MSRSRPLTDYSVLNAGELSSLGTALGGKNELARATLMVTPELTALSENIKNGQGPDGINGFTAQAITAMVEAGDTRPLFTAYSRAVNKSELKS